jgi:hypothetical protein
MIQEQAENCGYISVRPVEVDHRVLQKVSTLRETQDGMCKEANSFLWLWGEAGSVESLDGRGSPG